MPLRPLEGYTVGVTADRRWEDQAELLRRRGARVMHGPSIATQYLASDEALRTATASVAADPPDYLVATTGIGMRAWLEAAQAWGMGEALQAALNPARIVARGPKSAGAVQAAGLAVWQSSPNERLDQLVPLLLAEPLVGMRVAVQEAGAEAADISAALRAAGAEVVAVPVYRWRMPDDTGPALRLVDAACEGRVDAVTFTSAPAVQNLFDVAAGNDRDEHLRRAFNNGGLVAACVGGVCAGVAREHGIDEPVEPPVGRLGLMIRALSDRFEDRRRTLTLAGTEVIVQGFAVQIGDRVVEMPPLEQAAFTLLAYRPGAVVSRPVLLHRLWGSAAADPHLLEATITRLRRRLGPCGAALRPSPGRGYRLDVSAPVAAASLLDGA
ncbi:MAG TPA: uroporphyrinogen-III synthase [Acidimicrobiales bacterium]|nr:uroporphyrinogen-III synthase [Acidimicrobiales bacterium]